MDIVSISGNKSDDTIKIRYQKDYNQVELTRYLKSLHMYGMGDNVRFKVVDHLPFYEAPGPDFTGELKVSCQTSE